MIQITNLFNLLLIQITNLFNLLLIQITKVLRKWKPLMMLLNASVLMVIVM
nr:MAG: hypothetical protein [Prevotella phage R001]